ncbi:MAG: type II toxin-antitoxin system Phd/YefM family antitoxin [Burkholderiaceae bacterium]|uniref:type II toxin-antitoxin system Phd/YefM family antitoxin n=1 Tax=Hydrogenophaga sp. TaxID=1904254 RepID=UPI0027261EC3|nr:type II toxin-antitoxin system Phd/YefM family antitoxin [Hydrogenophaga sp.]MDO8277552.1 type II toxin-antitoxin system Phd/YefM family antitoxin [Burkholderiaceae bacterium]MDO9030959.1 type II toxin-antitoxin system Phd/YefM family antitoxin [Hydrogenophaga sp.]MDP1967772.1 type II toxin-antitoxin system Phd/YefM family antitoxin [Burkholderiaceae bacterium]
MTSVIKFHSTMDTVHIRFAKANLSAIVKAAERGCPTLITRQGVPAAMVIPLGVGRRLFPQTEISLATHLLALPSGLEAERDATPLRGVNV